MSMESILTKSLMAVRLTGELRTGFCTECGTQTAKEYYMDGERRRVRMTCPKCGGMGRLIVKTYSVQAPEPPKCFKAKCLWKFFFRVLYTTWLANYHTERVKYAQKNRDKDLPSKYRTGEDSPQTTWGCMKAVAKLKHL